MTRNAISIGGTLAVFLLTSPCLGIETERWATAGEWAILLRPGTMNACFAQRLMPDDSRVEIGFAATLESGYFAIYNAAWTHIEDGQKGVVEFNFGNARFAGEAVGRFNDGVPGGYAIFNNPAFVDEFARRQSVKIIGRAGAEFDLDLTGTHNAIAQIRACQAEQPSAAPDD